MYWTFLIESDTITQQFIDNNININKWCRVVSSNLYQHYDNVGFETYEVAESDNEIIAILHSDGQSIRVKNFGNVVVRSTNNMGVATSIDISKHYLDENNGLEYIFNILVSRPTDHLMKMVKTVQMDELNDLVCVNNGKWVVKDISMYNRIQSIFGKCVVAADGTDLHHCNGYDMSLKIDTGLMLMSKDIYQMYVEGGIDRLINNEVYCIVCKDIGETVEESVYRKIELMCRVGRMFGSNNIPKIIHQYNDNGIVCERWCELNDGYVVKTWTHDEIVNFANVPKECLLNTDNLKYIVLKAHGGVWLESNAIPLREMDTLISSFESVYGAGIVATTPNSQFINHVMDNFRKGVVIERLSNYKNRSTHLSMDDYPNTVAVIESSKLRDMQHNMNKFAFAYLAIVPFIDPGEIKDIVQLYRFSIDIPAISSIIIPSTYSDMIQRMGEWAKQTYPMKELVCCIGNGHINDEIEKILKRFQNKTMHRMIKIIAIKTPASYEQVYDVGVKNSSGIFISNIGSGRIYNPNCLYVQMRAINNERCASVVLDALANGQRGVAVDTMMIIKNVLQDYYNKSNLKELNALTTICQLLMRDNKLSFIDGTELCIRV